MHRVRVEKKEKWTACLIAADMQYDTKGMTQCIHGFICGGCKKFSVLNYKYCPNCGANMMGEQT